MVDSKVKYGCINHVTVPIRQALPNHGPCYSRPMGRGLGRDSRKTLLMQCQSACQIKCGSVSNE